MDARVELAADPTLDLALLRSVCRETNFDPGVVIRQHGVHYRDMYVITAGQVAVDLSMQFGRRKTVICGAGDPIGEIGFLRGWPATATVTAQTAVSALVIDDSILAHLERNEPVFTARLLRDFTATAERRVSSNVSVQFNASAYRGRQAVEVRLCRTREMTEQAQRLRYDVYCGELKRRSPNADHERRIISDAMDASAYVLIAVEAGEAIGTLRGNAASDGNLGVLEELYGMKSSPHHPQATCICTKFVIKKSKRGGPAAMKLIAAMVRLGRRFGMKECYGDCVPTLLPYYKAIGFTVAGEKFIHRENGLSYPLKLDLVQHGERLSKDPGVRQYVGIFARAGLIRFWDRLRKLFSGARH
jgi:CRP-like cAMP-binding protein